jgi:tRNAThr (cytosine32-N3)-methyltransferase
MIFVFSALDPETWQRAIKNIYTLLKPGGMVMFRDYGRHDLAQLRIKGARRLKDNFYIRGDGTRVYFFTLEELEELFGSQFEILLNAYDRRLIVNRLMRSQMHRNWIQAKFKKPDVDAEQ